MWRLLRSGGAGALAAGSDLLTLTLLVQGAGLSARVASLPALSVGAVVMFFGQKYLAFRRSERPTKREVALFALVQLGGLALTALLFDFAVERVTSLSRHYVVTRLLVTNLVWLAYSFPLWHLVFRPANVSK